MMIKKVFILLHITFALIPPLPQKANAIENTPLENELKIWSFKAVTELMSFRYDNLKENLEHNKAYLTKISCKRFLWVLRIYDISEGAIERGETVITRELWRKFTIPRKIDLIEIDKVSKKHMAKRGEGPDTIIWMVRVPVIVEFHKGLLSKKYRFLAFFEVTMEGKPAQFKITSWFSAPAKRAMNIEHSFKFNRSKYKLCDSIFP